MRARVILLALCLTGCARTQNIKEGETDYPRKNPHPIDVVHLSGSVDAPIRVRSIVNWSAGSKDCSYSPGIFEGASFLYHLEQPLVPRISGSHYDADIPVDGFLAGRCGWHFAGMTIEGAAAVMSGTAPGDASPTGPVDLYCRLSAGAYRCFARPGQVRAAWVHAGVTEIMINLHLWR